LSTAGAASLTTGANDSWISVLLAGKRLCTSSGPAKAVHTTMAAMTAWRNEEGVAVLPPPLFPPKLRCGSGSLLLILVLVLALDRTRILSLRVGIAIDQLDHRHRRGVPVSEARLQHPRI